MGFSTLVQTFHKYYEANIPVDFWQKEMQDFKGSQTLVKKYNIVTEDIKKSYINGARFCFAGSHGIGKSFTVSCILKRVVEKDFTALYVNLTDIINALVSTNENTKQIARKLLLEIDFLVIDEFDPRFIGSEKAGDLFGRTIEPVLRTRISNQLPLFICSNSPSLTDGFTGALETSIKSLMNLVKLVPLTGKDYREVLGGQ